MTPWYNLFSYWIFIGFLIRNLNKQLVPFSLYPCIITINIGLIILLCIKFTISTFNFTLHTLCITLVILTTHVVPLILVKPVFDKHTLIANLCVLIVYLIILHVQKLTIFKVYGAVLKENPNETFREYLKNRQLI
jgi:hypothetical protein